MGGPIEKYEGMLSQLPAIDNSWFGAALRAYREGDGAARMIMGSCLPIVLRIVRNKTQGKDYSSARLLDLVQDANASLEIALGSFPGADAREFLVHVERVVEKHVDGLLQPWPTEGFRG
jgi:hypothetical protein